VYNVWKVYFRGIGLSQARNQPAVLLEQWIKSKTYVSNTMKVQKALMGLRMKSQRVGDFYDSLQ